VIIFRSIRPPTLFWQRYGSRGSDLTRVVVGGVWYIKKTSDSLEGASPIGERGSVVITLAGSRARVLDRTQSGYLKKSYSEYSTSPLSWRSNPLVEVNLQCVIPFARRPCPRWVHISEESFRSRCSLRQALCRTKVGVPPIG